MKTTPLLRPALAALLALAACAPEDGPSMKPGSDCGECHGGGAADGEDGPRWTISGTVYASAGGTGDGVRGATVQVTDASGKVVTLHAQAVGNFYLADGLAFPLRTVSVERNGVKRTMQAQVQPGQGSCNRCHHAGSTASDSFGPVPGALFAP